MSVLESYSSINIWDFSAITLNFSQESGIIKFSRPQQFKSGSLFGPFSACTEASLLRVSAYIFVND